MERVKHNASQRKWNQRSLCASGRVAIERVRHELVSETASTTRVEVRDNWREHICGSVT